jgi:S-adenosylmethionine:tRNA ribosyltransferase-isomerase
MISIPLEKYTYELPNDKIAFFPIVPRDSSLQLIYNKGEIKHDRFARIAEHIPEDSLIVFNNTKVINARIIAQNNTGAQIEVFILDADNGKGIESVLNQKREVQLKCLVGNAKKFREAIEINKSEVRLTLTLIDKLEDAFIIKLEWNTDHVCHEIIDLFGDTPLPPYIKRAAESIDKQSYQTAFAQKTGSVAAPTAALHFSEEVLDLLAEKKIRNTKLTLHVGAGTFLPIKAKDIKDHHMHAESISVSIETLKMLKAKADQIIAIGTTSLRTLETLYWCGVKIKYQLDNVHYVSQWFAYEKGSESMTYADAIDLVLQYCIQNQIEYFQATTRILIMPGYLIRSSKALVTNFHQPGSTLLLLVAAFIGDDWKKVYAYALKNNFRFLSYGDSSLLWR